MRYLVAVLALTVSAAPSLPAQNKAVMTTHAKGTFDVKVIPQPADDQAGGPFGRLFLDKQFHGDLEATSNGQMLASGTGGENSSGAYVALERVSGTLQGRRGSFVLQHTGTMRKGVATMIVTVVPDSGTDGLTGLAGKMTIIIAGGAHSYALEYTLDGSQP
jgi:hypothetical protein